MSATYTTLADLVEQEITPALNGVEPNFDTAGFIETLIDLGLIEYVQDQHGFQLYTDDGLTPAFSELVTEFDLAAQK